MSREEAHKLLDRLFDLGYTGLFSFNFFKGSITNTEAKLTGIKNAAQFMIAV